MYRPCAGTALISHDVFINAFQKVDSPTKASTSCSLFLIRISNRQFRRGVDFLKPFNEYIVSDKLQSEEGTH